MGTLMKEPVLLPTSKSIVDKSSAKQMLLNNEIDPFNR
jgi:ubiquitin conjugation factor E4 B